jgi:hypothetical protein
MFPKRDPPSTPPQPAPAQLLPRRQAQPAMVQNQRRLRVLRARQALRSHARATATASTITIRVRPYGPPCDILARRRFLGGVRAAGRTRMFDRAAERSTR